LVVAAGDGAKFPATGSFDVVLCPVGQLPLFFGTNKNAEIARCTLVSTDTLTIVRAQYGTTAQTVAVGWAVDNAVTANLLSQLVAVSNASYAGKNAIINGGMEIAQRGTSFSGSGSTTYGLDRWCFQSSGSNTTFAQSSSSPPAQFRYFQSVTETSATSSTWYLAQSIETNNVIPFQNQVVTLSFLYKMPVNFTNAVTVSLRYSTGTDANLLNAGTAITITAGLNVNTSTGAITNESAWTQGTATFTVPSTATSLAVQFSSATDIVSTGQFNVTGVQLELGSVMTPFSRSGGSIEGELALCQRYYYEANSAQASDVYNVYGAGQCIAVTNAVCYINFPVTMRAAPATFTSSTASGFAIDSANGTGTSVTAIAMNRSTPANADIAITVASGMVAGNATTLHSNANQTSWLGLSAEL
jgi:hypothetical protein